MSQLSAIPASMSDFWLEVEHIKQTRGSDVEECNSSDSGITEDGEAEAAWLQDTGLSTLICDQSPLENNIIMSTLTQTQAAAVRRRLDTYSYSLRKRWKHQARDVRDVFTGKGMADGFFKKNGKMQTFDPTQALGKVSTVPYMGSESQHRLSGGANILDTNVAYSEQAATKQKEEQASVQDAGTFPKFQLNKGRLGTTHVSDLTPSDMKQVPALALIELTALCDILDLELKRNKVQKRKSGESHLFGVALPSLLIQDQKLVPDTTVPLILQAIFTCIEKNGMDIQGILRISGSQARIKNLQQRLEKDFYDGLFSWDDVHPHDASGLLKLFLRELPAPLLTTQNLPAFIAVQNIPDLNQRLQALNLLILILPEPNRSTLKALLEFLQKVAAREKTNLMSLWNVSTILAPNLFLYHGGKNLEKGEKQLAEGTAALMMAMVHYQDLLWTVPTFLVSQVRKLNESSAKRSFRDRRLRNFLRKIHTDKERSENSQTELCRQVKVQPTLWLKETLAVQVDGETRASDVFQQLKKQGQRGWDVASTVGFLRSSSEYPNLALFEVGGNLCEHRLDPDTYLMDLYNINPNAEWVIKPSSSSLPSNRAV
ncbi:rho GTPase-activating protein 40 isoform X2 [Xenopus laevis]|nr:rho GTPase-activating protein 40 isoform X2 [Xenopus laevis]